MLPTHMETRDWSIYYLNMFKDQGTEIHFTTKPQSSFTTQTLKRIEFRYCNMHE